MIMLLGQIPLPSIEQYEAFFKEEVASKSLILPDDYWDEEHDFDVLDYDIGITVDIPNDSIWADVTVSIRSLIDNLDTVLLHFDSQYTIESISEGTRELGWVRDSNNNLHIALDREVAETESLAVTFSYHGIPASPDGYHGLIINRYHLNPRAVTYTNCEPEFARTWIPCYDCPSDKATFTQRITVPLENIAVANGTLESKDTTGDWWTYTWREHYPQATYLIAFYASKFFVKKDSFATVAGEQMPIGLWLLKSDEEYASTFNSTPAIIEYYSEIFPPYPFRDEKYDQVDCAQPGAMENTTCTRMACFIGDFDWIIAHEMSHHWWGDWLTCGTWADLWLNEGFATYCEPLWWEKAYGKEGYDVYVDSITMGYYLEHGETHPIYDPPWEDLFGVVTYYKGGSVLHMLRQVLGDSIFFAGLNKYAFDNANENVITDDFQNEMEEVSGQDLDWFFDEWIYGPGHPHYETGWLVSPPAYQSSAAYEIEFAVSQMQDQSQNYYPFLMPLEIGVYHDGVEEIFVFTDSIGYQRFAVETSYEPDSFLLDPANKVLCEIVYHDDIDDVPEPGIEEKSIVAVSFDFESDAVFKDVLHVEFSNPSADQVTLSMYDASGRLVKMFYRGQSEKFHRIYPLSELSAGCYFLRLESAAGKMQTLKTVKIR